MKKGVPVEALTPKQLQMMHEIEAIPEDQIDLSDIPRHIPIADPRIGTFYRPTKKPVLIK